MQTQSTVILFLVCQIYTFGFWIRGAIAPIADVLEREFGSNASEIGLLSSILYLSYLLFQLPSGLLLQIYSGELVIVVSAVGLGLSSLAFAYSANVEMAISVHFLNGVFVAPAWIAAVSIASQRFGSENTALSTGIMIFWCKLWIVALSTLQAVIYEEYDSWTLPFIALTLILSAIALLLLFFLFFEHKTLETAESAQSRSQSLTEQELDTFDGDHTPLIPKRQKKAFSIYKENVGAMSVRARIKKMGESLHKTLRNPWN